MRFSLLVLLSVIFFSSKAQQMYPVGLGQNELLQTRVLSDSNTFNKKWSVTSYTGFNSSFFFGGGARGSLFSVPIGVQVNRRLNNNLFAFGQLATAPGYINLNPTFSSAAYSNQHGTGPLFNANAFGMSTRIAAGLMYVNDDRTFSISGSIGVERNNYPFLTPNNSPTQKTNVNGIRR